MAAGMGVGWPFYLFISTTPSVVDTTFSKINKCINKALQVAGGSN